MIALIDTLAGGGPCLPAVPSTHRADDARLLCQAARSLSALPGAAATDSAPRAAVRSLTAALAFCAGTAATPLEGTGVRRLGSGVPRVLLEALTAVVQRHPSLLDSAEAAAELARGVCAAAASHEAEVRRATGSALEALLATEGGVCFALSHGLVPPIARLTGDARDEATRAAAHRAAARLAASARGWDALRAHRPNWLDEVWSELREDATL